MFKARIKADSIKEFIGTVGALVDEAKMNVSEDGIQVKAVDPSHVAMIEANLVKSAFDSYEAAPVEMGIDVDKFKTVLSVAGKEDMVDMEKDDSSDEYGLSFFARSCEPATEIDVPNVARQFLAALVSKPINSATPPMMVPMETEKH